MGLSVFRKCSSVLVSAWLIYSSPQDILGQQPNSIQLSPTARKPCLATEDGYFRLHINYYCVSLLGSPSHKPELFHYTGFPHLIPNELPIPTRLLECSNCDRLWMWLFEIKLIAIFFDVIWLRVYGRQAVEYGGLNRKGSHRLTYLNP